MEEFFRAVHCHFASFNTPGSPRGHLCASGPCVGVGDAKQASGDGESGAVETGLTGTVAL